MLGPVKWLAKIPEVPATVRFLLYTAIGILGWNYRSAAIHDLLLVGAFVYALVRNPRGFRIWLRPAGVAFLFAGAMILVRLPAAGVAGESAGELLKYADIVLATLALPALMPTRKKIEAALFYSAWAVTAVLAYDLVRMVVTLKHRVFELGHGLEPFAFGHSNLSAVMGGAACLVLLAFAAILWQRRLVAVSCLGGVLICLGHSVCIASRGPQMALVGTFGMAAIVLPMGWRRKGLVGLLMFLAVAALAVNAPLINPRFAELESLRRFAWRDIVWGHTLTLIRQQPWVGYGWGKAVFEAVYHGSSPPFSWFHYHHAHQYMLQVTFATGLIGLLLHRVGWAALLGKLLLVLVRTSNMSQRLLPALVLLLIGYVHIYGLADWPAGIVGVMLTGLIPIALVVTGWPDED
jgi:O-antigen ligase